MIKCESCGASYDELEPVCPYCGSLNYIGSNALYHEKLDDIKEDLSNLPEEQVNEYVDTALSTTKKTGKFLLIAIAICLLVAGSIYYTMNIAGSRDYGEIQEWQDENYPLLDEMYEEGDYEGILDFMNNITEKEYEKGFSLYNWNHYEFISCYQGYGLSELIINGYDEYGIRDGELGLLIFVCIEGRYYIEEDTFTEQELPIIEESYMQIKDFLISTMGIEESKIDELYEESLCDGYILVTPAFDYGDSIEGEYQ